jgi:hypothetical protein
MTISTNHDTAVWQFPLKIWELRSCGNLLLKVRNSAIDSVRIITELRTKIADVHLWASH